MNWNQGRFPSLHHRKEGWLRHQENVAQQPKPTQPGWFSFCFQSENHPVRANAEASRYFLDRTANPPCGDARRGVSLDSNSFTPSMTPLQKKPTLMKKQIFLSALFIVLFSRVPAFAQL